MSKELSASRRVVTVTREGWYYLGIIAFIVVGSILRQINLLTLLAGLMIAPLLLNWRTAMAMMLRLKFRRVAPDWIPCGEPFAVDWEVENGRFSPPSWNLRISDRIHGPGGSKHAETTQAVALVPQVSPQQSSHAFYRARALRRGVYTIGPASITTRFPLGLIEAALFVEGQHTLYATPRLGTLTTVWHRRTRALMFGQQSKQRRRGMQDDEFYALRDWRPGDSRRVIHWRSTAKRGEVMVKQHDQLSDRDVALAVDLVAESPRDDLDTKVEGALSFLATVILESTRTVRGVIAVGISGAQTVVFDSRHHNFVDAVMQQLATATGVAETGIGECLVQLAERVSPGTPLVVISTRSRPRVIAIEPGGADVEQKLNWIQSAMWIEVDTAEFQELFHPAVAESTTERVAQAADAAPHPVA